MLDMPGFGAAPPLPDGVEPSAANLAAAIGARCDELGIERPHVAGNSLGAWVALEMGREGWAASVTALSPAGLWRRPLGPRRRDPHSAGEAGAAARLPGVAPAAPAGGDAGDLRRASRAHPASRQGRELVLGWIDASGYTGANRAMRTHLFDPGGYPEDVPVTIAWGELRPPGRAAEARAPARRRPLPHPAGRRPHPDLGRPGADRPHPAGGQASERVRS